MKGGVNAGSGGGGATGIAAVASRRRARESWINQPAVGPSTPLDRWTIAAALATGAVALALYLRTLATSLPTGDSGELISAAWVLGVAHPPGYPTFTMLTALFERLPLANPAIGANLLSALLSAGAAVVVGLTIARLAPDIGADVSRVDPTRDRTAPLRTIAAVLIGAGLLAVSTAFWSYAIAAEVFALNSLLAGAITLGMLAWSWRPGRTWPLWLAALLSGLALTNQQTIVLLAPGLLVLYVAGLRRAATLAPSGPAAATRLVRTIIVPVCLAFAGLLPYLYLPIAAAGDPPMNWGDPRTLDRFLAHVGRESYGSLRLVASEERGSIVDQLRYLGGYLVDAFSPVGVALGAGGFGWLAVRRRVEGAALLTMFLVAGPFFVVFANPPADDPVIRGILERFYILPSVPFAVAIGVGAAAGLGWLAARLPSSIALRIAPAVGLVATVALVGVVAVPRIAIVDRSGDETALTYARDILEPLPEGALLLMRGDEHFTGIRYAQLVAGVRRDVAALDVELLKHATEVTRVRRAHPTLEIPWRKYDDGVEASIWELARANMPERSVFVVGELKEDLPADLVELQVGLAYRVGSAGADDPVAAAVGGAVGWDRLRVPTRLWPDSTWEFVIGSDYGELAFELAVARQVNRPQADWAEIDRFYREAERLAPYLENAFKNHGLLMFNNDGDTAEIIRVWTRYLEFEPDDPDVAGIRAELAKLTGGQP